MEERRARPRQADDEDGRAAHFGPPRQAPRRGDDAEPHLEAPHEVVEGDEAADLCGNQPVERPVQQKLQTSLPRSNPSRFG